MDEVLISQECRLELVKLRVYSLFAVQYRFQRRSSPMGIAASLSHNVRWKGLPKSKYRGHGHSTNMRMTLKPPSCFSLPATGWCEVLVAALEAGWAGMTSGIVGARRVCPWRRRGCSRSRRAGGFPARHCSPSDWPGWLHSRWIYATGRHSKKLM